MGSTSKSMRLPIRNPTEKTIPISIPDFSIKLQTVLLIFCGKTNINTIQSLIYTCLQNIFNISIISYTLVSTHFLKVLDCMEKKGKQDKTINQKKNL